MNYSRLLLCVLFLACLSVHAQDASPAFKHEAMAATRQLAAFIALDDARQLPVRRFTQARLVQEAEARQQYANDADMLQKKLFAISQEYTQQLQQTLTPAQYQRYLAAAPGALPSSVAAVQVLVPKVPATGPVRIPAASTAKTTSGRSSGQAGSAVNPSVRH